MGLENKHRLAEIGCGDSKPYRRQKGSGSAMAEHRDGTKPILPTAGPSNIKKSPNNSRDQTQPLSQLDQGQKFLSDGRYSAGV